MVANLWCQDFIDEMREKDPKETLISFKDRATIMMVGTDSKIKLL